MSRPIETSTITVKTAVVVIVGILSTAGSIAGSYWASGAAVDRRLLELKYADIIEAQERKNADDREAEKRKSADDFLDMRVNANAKAIEVLGDRVDLAMKPSTVTTYR